MARLCPKSTFAESTDSKQDQNSETPIESSSRVHKAKDLLTTNLASPLRSCQINNTSKATDVPPVSVPQPSELTSRRLFKADVGHHSRLFASGQRETGCRSKPSNSPALPRSLSSCFHGVSCDINPEAAREGKRRPLSSRVI